MRKEWKRLLLIVGCLLIGCLLGYFVSVTQAREQEDPSYLAYFEEHDLPVPEPAEPLTISSVQDCFWRVSPQG